MIEKEKLRPVKCEEFKHPTDPVKHGMGVKGHEPEIFDGYFHCWEANDHRGTQAIIEKLNGEIIRIGATRIQFMDRVKEKQN
ncbi:MAG: hypothetical protein JWO32_1310 [Bacteroidetes bacterium]|nr:hypothetical protein [Bacteroidota bacterium]